jgi:hypothetical protein
MWKEPPALNTAFPCANVAEPFLYISQSGLGLGTSCVGAAIDFKYCGLIYNSWFEDESLEYIIGIAGVVSVDLIAHSLLLPIYAAFKYMLPFPVHYMFPPANWPLPL